MASEQSVQPQKPIAEMLKSLESDNPSNTGDGVIPTPHTAQNGSLSDKTSCIPSMDAVNGSKETESDYHETSVEDQSIYYPMNYGYYYPAGSEMQYGEWNEQGYMGVSNGTEMQPATIQSNDAPLTYYMPGFQPGYDPYTSLIPGAILGVDGMYLGQQPYVTNQVTPQSDGSFVSYQPLAGYGQEMISAYGYEAPLWNFNNTSGNARNFSLPSATTRPKYPVKKVHLSKPASKSRGGSVEDKGSHLVLELAPRVEVPNPSIKSSNKTFTSSKRYPSPAKSLLHTYEGKSDVLSPNVSNGTNNKENGRSSVPTEKSAPRNKSVNGFGNTDLLSEKNSGPRINHSKNISTSTSYRSSVPAGSELDDKCGSANKTVLIKRDDYNLLDFPIKYEHALFFIIKSYSEDDIHKSIKYNVWTSTSNGNKKLDNAFHKIQENIGERGLSSSKCPVFLFFSVNASGQFCGVAEMIGGVDFNKHWNFWQQDKWNGSFPVKWHIIKDVPNSHFRHIILANNDSKPVTNSRDTQEIMFQQGSDMLSIFKGFSNKTCILDDFGFYENRQKVMQGKRNKMSSSPAAATLENFQPKSKQTTDPIISSMETLTLSSTKTVTTKKPEISESSGNS